MQALLEVILPVFVVLGFGYLAAWARWISEAAIDGVMRYAQSFAVPCLLFLSISRLDLAANFDAGLLTSFYVGAFAGFAIGAAGARYLFGRSPEDAVAIGFCCLFSNTLLLGLPITERAYGVEALAGNYAIIALHAPMLYVFGILVMEVVRARSGALSHRATAGRVLRAIVTNPLVLAVALGVASNLSGVTAPGFVEAGLEMMSRSALPAALFALGGVLVRYRPEGDARVTAMITGVALIVHPAITYALGRYGFALDTAQMRSAVVTAAMSPGINAYIFASLYGAAQRVVAASVLIATMLSILTIWVWLAVLP